MATRKNHKSKKSNKRFRKTRSKKQKGGGPFNCSEIASLSCGNYQVPEIVNEYLRDNGFSERYFWKW